MLAGNTFDEAVRDRPSGSFVAGTPAEENALEMASLRAWCLRIFPDTYVYEEMHGFPKRQQVGLMLTNFASIRMSNMNAGVASCLKLFVVMCVCVCSCQMLGRLLRSLKKVESPAAES